MRYLRYLSLLIISLFLIGCSKTPPEICASITSDEMKQQVFSLLEKDQYFYGTLCKEGTDCLLSSSQQEKFKEIWNVFKNKSELLFRLVKSEGTSSRAECLTEVRVFFPLPSGKLNKTNGDATHDERHFPWMPLKVIVYKEPFKKIVEIENSSWYKLNRTPWRATSEIRNAEYNWEHYYPFSEIVANDMRSYCVISRCSPGKGFGVDFFEKSDEASARYWERTYKN